MDSKEHGRIRRGTLWISLAALMVTGAHAAAQNQSRPEKDQQPTDVLRGPDVRDNSVPGQRNRFGGGSVRDKGQGRDATPARLFMQALATLRAESTPADVRLTTEQEASLKKMQEEFRSDQLAFAKQHRDEIMQLRQKLSPEALRRVDQRLRGIPGMGGPENRARPGQGDKPLGRPDRMPGGDEMSQDAMQDKPSGDEAAALNRLREIAETAPDPAAIQTKAWSVLSAPQKEVVEKELARLRQTGKAKRPDGTPATDASKTDGTPDLSKLPPKVRERLEKLPPAEQERLLKRYAEQNGKRKGEGRNPRPDSRPSPDMEDVDVPDPDSESQPK